MTNRIAIWLGLVVVALLIADRLWLGGAGLLFLARKFDSLIEWLAFWR